MTTYQAVEIIENGGEDDDQVVEAFQALIDTGTVWLLQGWYGRTAQQLIDTGCCHLPTFAGSR